MTLLIVLGAIAVLFYALYVGLIKKRNAAFQSLSDIDTQLQMRHNLIPNILTIAKRYMQHEDELLTKITDLRSRGSASYDKSNSEAIGEHLSIASQLSAHMGKLQVAVEAYPTLKADTLMTDAMQAYNEAESRVSASRRAYNANVTVLNNAVQIFPSSVIASMIAIKAMPYFEADEESRKAVNASDYLY